MLWNALQTRVEHLTAYGPVWATEFADTMSGSPDTQMDFSTREAALGFAEVVGQLWALRVDGIIHFRLADTYPVAVTLCTMPSPYTQTDCALRLLHLPGSGAKGSRKSVVQERR